MAGAWRSGAEGEEARGRGAARRGEERLGIGIGIGGRSGVGGGLRFGRRTQRSNPACLARRAQSSPRWIAVLDARAAHVQGRETFGVSGRAGVGSGWG